MKTTARAWKFDGLLAPLAWSALIVCMGSGCATRGNVELLEAQLRRQESLIQTYEKTQARLQADLKTSQRELDLVRTSLAANGQQIVSEEAASSLARAEKLTFNSLLTAAQDHDGNPGDERFHALFYPCDAQGEIVKLSGEIEFEIIDPALPAGSKTIGHWKYTAPQARDLWHAGFLSSGYQIDEAWQQAPTGSEVVLMARLQTADGRKFEATHTLPVLGHESLKTAEPKRLPTARPAQEIQRASFESAADRPVPDPEPAKLTKGVPQALPRPVRAVHLRETAHLPETSAPLESSGNGSGSTGSASSTGSKVESGTTARPFPAAASGSSASISPGPATVTSDRWTEAEIPVRR